MQYVHLALENWFLCHCQKRIVPQQSSVPASGDLTPVSPAKAICTCVHCSSICAVHYSSSICVHCCSICAAAHLPQPRPVPDPALSFHCQVSYFQLRPLRTVLYFPKTQTFQSYSSGPIFGKRWNNNWKKKLIYVNQRIRCDHPVTSVIRDWLNKMLWTKWHSFINLMYKRISWTKLDIRNRKLAQLFLPCVCEEKRVEISGIKFDDPQ